MRVDDYSVSQTSLEQVFLSFAHLQPPTRTGPVRSQAPGWASSPSTPTPPRTSLLIAVLYDGDENQGTAWTGVSPTLERQPRQAFVSGGPKPALQSLDHLYTTGHRSHQAERSHPTFAPGEAGGQQAGATSLWAAWVWSVGCPSPIPKATWPD